MSTRLPDRGNSIALPCLLVSLLTSAAGAAPPASAPKAPAKVKLQGTVIDDSGRPMEGAVVTGTVVLSPFRVSDPSYQNVPLAEILTSSRGAFSLELPGPRAGLVVYLHARHKNAFTARPLELDGAALEKPITLKVSPSNARGLRVHVVDEEGKPVAATTAVRYRPRFLRPHRESFKLTRHSGRATDRQGRFEVSPCLDPDGFYQIEVKAEGYPEDRTPWKETGTEPVLDFGDLTLRKQRELQGQVLDHQGKPVAGARVVHASGRGKVQGVTDGEGHFKLTTTFHPPGFVFVEGPGFRFHGQRCDRPEPLKITLVRREEKPAKGMATLPPALPRGERKQLAARLLEPLLGSTQDRGDVLRSAALEALGRLDPGRMIEELDRKPHLALYRDSLARLGAMEALLIDSPEEARTLIASMKNADGRIRGYLKLCEALPDSKRAEKLALLDQALQQARTIETSEQRVLKMGWVAGRLWALGEKERATKLLREAQQLARRLPTNASAGSLGAFAEYLGLIDLEAALDLLNKLPSFSQGLRRGNLARKLAADDPAAAERVLDTLLRPGDTSSLAQWDWHRFAPQVCYGMAQADLPRARKIADRITDPSIKARTYGLMARALAHRRPKEARTLLERAFVVLQEQGASGKDSSSYRGSPAAVAGLLLPVAEAIDADLVPEYFWQTLSLTATALPREAGDEESQGFAVRHLGELALVLARYDRELALGFVEEVRAAPATGSSRQPYLLAAALADPRRAVALVEELTDGRDKDTAGLAVVRLLLAERQGVWKQVHRALGLWFADEDDL